METRTVTLLPGGRAFPFSEGSLLIDILADAGVHVNSPCGGKGICGRCLVRAEGSLSPVTPQEARFLREPGSRLACLARATGDITVTVPATGFGERDHAFTAEPGARYGMAVDIGTTTIKASLVDRVSGIASPVATSLNPQRRYGHDVITRIAASADPEVHRRLVDLLRGEIAAMAEYALSLTGGAIDSLAFSGNTVMTSYLLGLDVRPLGVYPYRAPQVDFSAESPVAIGLSMASPGGLQVNPAASAFLGGDLVGGLALLHGRGLRERIFFIDLGTNGEMFLSGADGEVSAASCAMGPALEGMSIHHGMTASEGAITRVTLAGDRLACGVLGGGTPVGISGTGIIDLLALLLRRGVIDRTGRFAGDAEREARALGMGWNAHGKALELPGGVLFTQRDVRSVQLAKGASLAAAAMLLRETGTPPDSVATVAIAGAFGEHMDIGNFRALGFLPDFPVAEYRFLGNTSLQSAERSCLDPGFHRTMTRLRNAIRVVELNELEGFNEAYIRALDF
ncbi:MAG: DUF4445 domain-containing protein [Spirochaetes bacterium]|nr:DUF4445 domain-containing protein [Spirochaetota bacterium]